MAKALAQVTRVDKLPVYKTMWWTFTGSIRCIVRHILNRLDTTYGEELIRWWWSNILAGGRATVSGEGKEHLDATKPYVFMSNHTSLLDIPAMFAAVWPMRIRMVSKTEIGRIPFFGNALKRLDFVFIDRGAGTRAIRQLEKAKEVLHKGVSVWLAPEGTRTRTGRLGPFKKGGFHLAIQLGIPIVPTWIEGASDIIPPDTFDCAYDGHITVRFGKPILTEGCTRADVPRLMAETRRQMLELSKTPAEVVDGGQQRQNVPATGPLTPGFVRLTGAVSAAEAAQRLHRAA